jgi:hypothetical protein
MSEEDDIFAWTVVSCFGVFLVIWLLNDLFGTAMGVYLLQTISCTITKRLCGLDRYDEDDDYNYQVTGLGEELVVRGVTSSEDASKRYIITMPEPTVLSITQDVQLGVGSNRNMYRIEEDSDRRLAWS